ncbi:MAG: hypothetical protein MI784_01600 [Cytophagales bacterium]|nr:hypothetical protein [Cytophagales bacterium]
MPGWHTCEAPDEESLGQTPIPVESSACFDKGEVLLKNRLIEMQADLLIDCGSDLEIVSKPFEDSPEGFLELQQSLLMVRKIFTLLENSSEQVRMREFEARDLGEVVRPRAFLHRVPVFKFREINAQVTVGLRLSRFADLFRDFGIGAEEETGRQYERRRPGRIMSGLRSAKMPFLKHLITGNSVFLVEEGLRKFWITRPCPPFPEPSKELVSLLCLMLVYLSFGSMRVSIYPKAFTRYLMRTDFSRLFESLPSHEKKLFRRENGKHWMRLFEILLSRKHLQTKPPYKQRHIDPLFRDFISPVDELPLQAPFFSKGVYHNRQLYFQHPVNLLDKLTRKDWIANIPLGVDLLTERCFPDRTAASHLESLGEFGVKADRLEDGELAPVFELRHIAWPSEYGLQGFIETMRLLFAYFYALNRGIDYKFGEPVPAVLTGMDALQETDV